MPISPKLAAEIRRSHVAPSLPDELVQLIGQIIIHWAAIEDELRESLALAVGIDTAIGRLAIREPRAHEQIALLQQVLETQGIEPPHECDGLAKALKKAGDDRHKLAHGTWVLWPQKSGGYSARLHLTGGKWPENRQLRFGMRGATPKKVVRHASEFSVADAEAILWNLIALGREVVSLKMTMIGLSPSRRKSRK